MFSILKLIHTLISNWLDNNANQRFSRQDVSPRGFFPDIYDDPYRGDELRDSWAFRVGTWNVESLTGRSGELVEALGERRIDIACAGNSVER